MNPGGHGDSERGLDTRLCASASGQALAVRLAVRQLLPCPWIRIDGLSSNGPVKNTNLRTPGSQHHPSGAPGGLSGQAGFPGRGLARSR